MLTRSTIKLSMCALWVAAAAAVFGASQRDPDVHAFAGINGKIAFTSDRDGNEEIYVMNSDGSSEVNLSYASYQDRSGAWSPNGVLIAFATVRNLYLWDIFISTANGTVVDVVAYGESEYDPAWSGDGTKIAYTDWSGAGGTNIWVDCISGPACYAHGLTSSGYNSDPAWSPDGTKIAYRSTNGVSVMSADGSSQTLLASGGFEPAWSPDGSKIAYDSGGEIYAMNANGSGQTPLTSNPATDREPVWSPDGTKVAFASNRGGNFDIYVMNADGTGQTALTDSPGADVEPDWQPLGSSVGGLTELADATAVGQGSGTLAAILAVTALGVVGAAALCGFRVGRR